MLQNQKRPHNGAQKQPCSSFLIPQSPRRSYSLTTLLKQKDPNRNKKERSQNPITLFSSHHSFFLSLEKAQIQTTKRRTNTRTNTHRNATPGRPTPTAIIIVSLRRLLLVLAVGLLLRLLVVHLLLLRLAVGNLLRRRVLAVGLARWWGVVAAYLRRW